MKFYGQKSEKKLSLKIRKNSERKNNKEYFFRKLYSGHVDRILRTMPKVSAENPKRFKTWKKYKATSWSCGHAEVSFHKFLKFFGQKSESILLKIRKISEKKNKKKLFFPQILLWTRRWKFENHAKGFCRKSKTIQNFRKNFRVTNCSSGHVEGSFENFWSVLAKSLKIYRSKFEKILKRKTKKTFFSAIFNLDS